MNRFVELAARYLEKNIGIPITKKIPCDDKEKVRVAFILQVTSFWPALEPLYSKMRNTDTFETTIVCYDENIDPTIKTETTREYLQHNNYEFIDWRDFDLNCYKPHIVFLQTPYDTNRRKEYTSSYMTKKGCRVIYVPYGIETGDTKHSQKAQFEGPVIRNAWKIYVNSETIRRDYVRNMYVKTEVVATGLPRFDSLYNKQQFNISDSIKAESNGRKIVLWKVHFPKDIEIERNKIVRVTPDIKEYIKFIDYIDSNEDLLFIFMPHPRFFEYCKDEKTKEQLSILLGMIKTCKNIRVDFDDDYRPTLVNSDAVIADRGTIMVEAGTIDVPVLYMHNEDYYEPMNEAISPLVESYIIGTRCEDMIAFSEDVIKGIDSNKNLRNNAVKECFPMFDGNCSQRIINNILDSMKNKK